MADKKVSEKSKEGGSDSSSRRDRVDRPSFHRDRPSPYPRGPRSLGPRPSTTPRLPPYNRVFIQNIPYEERWQGLKDLFRDKVGEVTYVELFTDEAGKSRGYGIVEFKTKDLCVKAVDTMNRHEINSRKILVKLDYDGEHCRKALLRDNHPAVMGMGGGPGPMHPLPPPMHGPPPPHMHPLPPMPPPMGMGPGGMGLPPHLPPPMRRDPYDDIGRGDPMMQGVSIFVANLDYKVTYSKLKEVFSLAGRVLKVDLILDKDNKSRGMATITFETLSQAENAISMLNNQKLYDRTMVVKMDRANSRDKGHGDLPSGLSGIGPSIQKKDTLPAGLSDLGSSRGGGYGDTGNGISSKLGSSADSPLSTLAAISELGKTGVASEQAKLAAGLSALTRLGDRLPGQGAGLDLGALTGLSELARLGLAGAARKERLEERIIDERIRMLTAPRTPTDRERIERDIQRVDSRIRDIDRSLERGRDHLVVTKPLPPMPPPMHVTSGMPDSQVFVRNLPYSVSWQTLRDKFSRCGRVLFAEIKNDNGKSRGYGSVRFETPEQAESAVRHLDGMDIEGRKIIVHLDRKQ